MTKEQYLLTQLAEEAAEIAKEALKAVRFGSDDRYPNATSPTLRERLQAELSDLVGTVEELDFQTQNPERVPLALALSDRRSIIAKRIKIRDYMGYSAAKGILKV